MPQEGRSNYETRNPSPAESSRGPPLNVTNPELFHMNPRPGGYVNIVSPYVEYSVAHNCCCVGDINETLPDTRFPSRGHPNTPAYTPARACSGPPIQAGPACFNVPNCDLHSVPPHPSSKMLPLTSHTTKSVVSIGSTHSRVFKLDHQVKCVAESGAIVFIPSKEFRLEQQTLDFYEHDMSQDQDQALWETNHLHIYDPSYDTMELLSGTISTVMLMAAGVTSIPEDYFYWTGQYLECMRDDENNHPYNINAILSHMLWLKRGDVIDGREEFRLLLAGNPGHSGGIGPSERFDGGVAGPVSGEVGASRTGSPQDNHGGIDGVGVVSEGFVGAGRVDGTGGVDGAGEIDGSRAIGGSRGIGGAGSVPFDGSGTTKHVYHQSSMAVSPSRTTFKGPDKKKKSSLMSKKSPTSTKSTLNTRDPQVEAVHYGPGSPSDRGALQDVGTVAGSQYNSPMHVASPVKLGASQPAGTPYNAQAVSSPYNASVVAPSMNAGSMYIASSTSHIGTLGITSPVISSLMTGSSRTGNPKIGRSMLDSPVTDSPRNGSPRNSSPRNGSPRNGSPRNGSPKAGISRNGSPLIAKEQDPLNIDNQQTCTTFRALQDQSSLNNPQVFDNGKRCSSNMSNKSQVSHKSQSSHVLHKPKMSYSNKVSDRSQEPLNYDEAEKNYVVDNFVGFNQGYNVQNNIEPSVLGQDIIRQNAVEQDATGQDIIGQDATESYYERTYHMATGSFHTPSGSGTNPGLQSNSTRSANVPIENVRTLATVKGRKKDNSRRF